MWLTWWSSGWLKASVKHLVLQQWLPRQTCEISGTRPHATMRLTSFLMSYYAGLHFTCMGFEEAKIDPWGIQTWSAIQISVSQSPLNREQLIKCVSKSQLRKLWHRMCRRTRRVLLLLHPSIFQLENTRACLFPSFQIRPRWNKSGLFKELEHHWRSWSKIQIVIGQNHKNQPPFVVCQDLIAWSLDRNLIQASRCS